MKLIRKLSLGRNSPEPKPFLYFNITEDEFREFDDEYIGFCLGCGAERGQCEPDARKYECEECGERRVYGTSELLLMGRIEIGGEDDEE